MHQRKIIIFITGKFTIMKQFFYTLLFFAFILSCCQTEKEPTVVRFATFNVALYRSEGGQLQKDLAEGDNKQR